MDYVAIENITFPPSFFVPEVRNGFYISEMMKRSWACQLVILSEIAKVCKKHNILWFANFGTLLGAIRHKGFIPWDDDIDILLMRHDLDRLFEVAQNELPENYIVLDSRLNGSTHANPKITNGRTIGVSGNQLRIAQGFPFISAVDLYVLDGIYEDSDTLSDWLALTTELTAAIALAHDHSFDRPEYLYAINRIEERCRVKVPAGKNAYPFLLALEEDLHASCPSQNAREVAMMQGFTYDGRYRYPKEVFGTPSYWPFEHTLLPVPTDYEFVLRSQFHNYLEPKRGAGSHSYPSYDSQEQMLKKKTGKNTGRYTLLPEALPLPERTATRGKQIGKLTAVLTKAQAEAEKLEQSGNRASAAKLLHSCEPLLSELDQLLSAGKEIVFLPVKAEWWDTMEPLYRTACADDTLSVTVIAVPYLVAEPDGSNPVPADDRAYFPSDVIFTEASAYDFGKHLPDIIVIQHPYDEWSFSVHLPDFFRSGNLRQFTDRLVYIPCHDVDTPAQDDLVSREALKVLIEQPAVVNSDAVVVKDEEMRTLYIDSLTHITGENSRPYWEERITDKEHFSLLL